MILDKLIVYLIPVIIITVEILRVVQNADSKLRPTLRMLLNVDMCRLLYDFSKSLLIIAEVLI